MLTETYYVYMHPHIVQCACMCGEGVHTIQFLSFAKVAGVGVGVGLSIPSDSDRYVYIIHVHVYIAGNLWM